MLTSTDARGYFVECLDVAFIHVNEVVATDDQTAPARLPCFLIRSI